VWINLPNAGANVELLRDGLPDSRVQVVQIDAWRVAVVLKGLPEGEYRWEVRFR
jgi:hypothetical protein